MIIVVLFGWVILWAFWFFLMAYFYVTDKRSEEINRMFHFLALVTVLYIPISFCCIAKVQSDNVVATYKAGK